MMKRCQHITKLQSELIKEKKLIDQKLDETIAKHCYLEKAKYEILPQVVIPKIPHDMKFTKLDKNQNTTLHTIPITPPNTPSKETLQKTINKKPLMNTQQPHCKRMTKHTFLYNFNDEIDDTTLLGADYN